MPTCTAAAGGRIAVMAPQFNPSIGNRRCRHDRTLHHGRSGPCFPALAPVLALPQPLLRGPSPSRGDIRRAAHRPLRARFALASKHLDGSGFRRAAIVGWRWCRASSRGRYSSRGTGWVRVPFTCSLSWRRPCRPSWWTSWAGRTSRAFCEGLGFHVGSIRARGIGTRLLGDATL